jgi:phosphoglycolate phosphatase-like HAD superfamily hydrolase
MAAEKPRAVICDLDGTLCNVAHREHFMRVRPKQREEFHSACVKDEIVKPVQELISIFRSAGYRIVFLTMRPARFRLQTEAWLAAHGVAYDELLMAADTRPDAEQKRSMYEEFLHPRYDVRFVIDDRASVVAMWREMGLMVLDVAGADF